MDTHQHEQKDYLYWTVLAISLLAISAFFSFLPILNKNVPIEYKVLNSDGFQRYEPEKEIIFINLTKDKRKARWYLGSETFLEGDTVKTRFLKEDTYKITLEIGNKKKEFDLNVFYENKGNIDTVAFINAPDHAFVGEEIFISASESRASDWRWKFGESNMYDAYGSYNFYSYTTPGIKTISLYTDVNTKPLIHKIEIRERFKSIDPTPPIDYPKIAENYIKQYLQRIASSPTGDFSTFKQYRDSIEIKYLKQCYSENTIVVSNQKKVLDFYSYCQDLHHLDSDAFTAIKIDAVKVEYDSILHCVKKIEVTQSQPKK